MDANWARSLFTLWVFVSFLLVIYIVFNRRNKKNYDDAANSIFDNNDDNTSDKNGR
jgi:hypothetical protein